MNQLHAIALLAIASITSFLIPAQSDEISICKGQAIPHKVLRDPRGVLYLIPSAALETRPNQQYRDRYRVWSLRGA
jgi:hypothetical protein